LLSYADLGLVDLVVSENHIEISNFLAYHLKKLDIEVIWFIDAIIERILKLSKRDDLRYLVQQFKEISYKDELRYEKENLLAIEFINKI